MVAVLTNIFRFENLEIAEDIVQETLLAAYRTWSYGALPERPAAWLMAVAKNKALNVLKSDRRKSAAHRRLSHEVEESFETNLFGEASVDESMLRLIFACCHPAISAKDQIALILKTLCGFASYEVARALLITEETVNKRLYRAKVRIQEQQIVLEIPDGVRLEERLDVVCTSVYLLFNEGYAASQSQDLIRKELCFEAMRLCRLLVARFPEQPRVPALMALMCLHAARFDSRVDPQGGLVLLEDQDRSKWDSEMIQIGLDHLFRSARGYELSVYHLEASIAAQHCLAESFEQTDWPAIRRLYDALYQLKPSPLVRLSLAIVLGHIEGPRAALIALDELSHTSEIAQHPLLHAALGVVAQEVGDTQAAQHHFTNGLQYVAPSCFTECSERPRLFLPSKYATAS